MSRILILSLVGAPDGVSTSIIVSELAQDLQDKGHAVTVLTTVPHYNIDPDARAQQPLQRRWGGLFYRSDYHGIPVWHTYMRPKGNRIGGRLLDYMIFHVISLLLGLFVLPRQDVVLAVSPPLTIGVIGWLLARFKRARFVYNVQELYPETAVRIGVLREGSCSVRVFEWIERFIYRRAHILAVICDAFAQAIARKGIPARKIQVIPNFVDVDTIRPLPKDNSLAQELDLVERFVVLYAGNIGLTQSLDCLLAAAERLRDHPIIRFLIVGDGARRAYVAEQVGALSLTNVILLPYQPRSRVPEIYATADVGLVPLMEGTAQTTVPSKLYTIMASARPALVAVDAESDLVETVHKAQCGLVIPPDDVDALISGIVQMYEQRACFRELGENGRRYVEQNMARAVISDRYHALFVDLTR